MCGIVSLWSSCGISLFFSQEGGAISISDGALTFEGLATFTSCSAEASDMSGEADSVSGGELLSVEVRPTYGGSITLKIKSGLICQ